MGRFTIYEYVGQGDLGLVFRACGPGEDSVALKVLHGLAEPRLHGRTTALARRLVGLRHASLASVLDHGDHEEVPYLVEQHVAGRSLAERLRRGGGLERPAVLPLLRGIAEGVDHAHRCGFVHGALKPEQVVLDEAGRPLVTDFGLAALRWPAPDGEAVAVGERSAVYAAPEVLAGGPPTAAADRYAFAAMAYELLAGRPPFAAESDELAFGKLDAEPPAPSRVGEDLTDLVDGPLLRGLARDPLSRWESCVSLTGALEDAFAARPRPVPAPVAAPVPADPRVVRSRRRVTRSAALAGAGLVGLAAMAVAAAGWLSGQPGPISITLSTGVVAAGSPLTVTATGLPGRTVGTIELRGQSEQIGIFQANDQGGARSVVTVPGDVALGKQTIALCWDGGCHGSADVSIVPPGAIASREQLATPLPGGWPPIVAAPANAARAGGAPASAGRAGPVSAASTPAAPSPVAVPVPALRPVTVVVAVPPLRPLGSSSPAR